LTLFAQLHGNDGLFARFLPAPKVRHPPAKAGLKGDRKPKTPGGASGEPTTG